MTNVIVHPTTWTKYRRILQFSPALAQTALQLPRDHRHLAVLDSSCKYLRQFTSQQVLDAVRFDDGNAATGLLAAVEILARPAFRGLHNVTVAPIRDVSNRYHVFGLSNAGLSAPPLQPLVRLQACTWM
ncbi:hypothetical protein [Amycolatopsis sp. NPDC051371]|uniref:hypothetical protein n=1 Tax=Amycolatopsis sp. NPDC051371 TaxID=3155800 RepID=UPI003412B0A0